jgi:capsular polysaccharide biosynthesis protein
VSTIEAVIDHFHDADICVGIHGAGLANCVLVRGAKKKNLI